MAETWRSDDSMAMMALGFIDLRAQYQAALRTLAHAERCLLECRTPDDRASFQGCLTALRAEVVALSATNRSVRELLDQIARDIELLA